MAGGLRIRSLRVVADFRTYFPIMNILRRALSVTEVRNTGVRLAPACWVFPPTQPAEASQHPASEVAERRLQPWVPRLFVLRSPILIFTAGARFFLSLDSMLTILVCDQQVVAL